MTGVSPALSETVSTWYHTLWSFRRHFPQFRPTYCRALSLLLPPPYLAHLWPHWPRLLHGWEEALARRWSSYGLGDHFLMVLKRRQDKEGLTKGFHRDILVLYFLNRRHFTMMYPRSEILFPHQCVSTLRDLRGPLWQELVDRVADLPDTHEESLAFALMMIELAGCLDCDLDSYKASLGCCICARRTINAFKGSDKMLLQKYQQAREELEAYMEKGKSGSDLQVEGSQAESEAP